MLKFKKKYLKFKKLETFNVFISEHIKIQNILLNKLMLHKKQIQANKALCLRIF